MEKRFVLPGEYFISKRPIILDTLVGSCVCVCIYNVKDGVAAMNHFLQSEPNGQEDFDIAHKVPARYRVRIVHEEVGGVRGRRVKFDTGTKKVFCRFAGEVGKKFNKV